MTWEDGPAESDGPVQSEAAAAYEAARILGYDSLGASQARFSMWDVLKDK